MKVRFSCICLTLLILLAGCPTWAQQNRQSSRESVGGLSYADYGRVLNTYVNSEGLVDYRGLKRNRDGLDRFVSDISRLDPAVYDRWPDKEKIAFWINAYNGLTLKAIIDHYPIQWSFLRAAIYPRNSIRQIPGVWDGLKFRVMGKDMTLDQIEHGVLRARFNEPRIHMALVCAAMGCPPLRNEAYRADRLDSQLDDQARRFLNNPNKLRIGRDQQAVYLSPIFDWFGNDFIKTYGTDEGFKGHSPEERAVLSFVSRYLNDTDRTYLAEESFTVSFLSYDWSLNEQPSE